MPLRFANRVLSFANRNVENLLSKLDGIARTFDHETSMPQAAPSIYAMKVQTEALPSLPFSLLTKGDYSLALDG